MNASFLSQLLFVSLFLFGSCRGNERKPSQGNLLTKTATENPEKLPDSAAKQIDKSGYPIPIIAFHQIREWRSQDTKNDKVYITSSDKFRAEIKMLHDSGYHTILPDQLIAWLNHGAPLPERPVMLTFDDATASQYETGMSELEKYGYKGVFFIMTVVLGHKEFMTREQVKDIADHGHSIECHTWDHHMVTKYQEKDWAIQVEKPKALLESITHQPVKYFAYPYGLWNINAIEHLKKSGFVAAFQLSEKQDPQYPLFTIRRILADGNWEPKQLIKAIKNDFKFHE